MSSLAATRYLELHPAPVDQTAFDQECGVGACLPSCVFNALTFVLRVFDHARGSLLSGF
jgi:hypothetical protein